jgi:hypothetical protein
MVKSEIGVACGVAARDRFPGGRDAKIIESYVFWFAERVDWAGALRNDDVGDGRGVVRAISTRRV